MKRKSIDIWVFLLILPVILWATSFVAGVVQHNTLPDNSQVCMTNDALLRQFGSKAAIVNAPPTISTGLPNCPQSPDLTINRIAGITSALTLILATASLLFGTPIWVVCLIKARRYNDKLAQN